MSENCNHNCDTCASKCAQGFEKEKLNQVSSVKKLYAVVSGKGGVGKSNTAINLAIQFKKMGQRVFYAQHFKFG